MIKAEYSFFSHYLCRKTKIYALIPNGNNFVNVKKDLLDLYKPKQYDVLYLLHGAMEDAFSWISQTNLENYLEETGIIAILVEGLNSFYTDAGIGNNYYSYISKELPLFINNYLPAKNTKSYIAGASMGGYGAANIALKNPKQYEAFASFSGALDIDDIEVAMKEIGFDFFDFKYLFNSQGKELEKLIDPQNKVKAYLYCASDDEINEPMNKHLYELLKENNYPVSYKLGKGGHGYQYWDTCLADFLINIKGKYL